MATVIQFVDGRAAYVSSAIASGLLKSVAEDIENEGPLLARWLRDKALRPAPFMDIDLGSLEPDIVDLFFRGLHRLLLRDDQLSLGADIMALARKLDEMHRRALAGEPIKSMSDFDKPLPRKKTESLTEIWSDP